MASQYILLKKRSSPRRFHFSARIRSGNIPVRSKITITTDLATRN